MLKIVEFHTTIERRKNGQRKTATNPKAAGKPKIDPLTRFYQNYSIAQNGCWLWSGYIDNRGYAIFFDGITQVRAHRWAYEWFIGAVPDGEEVHHICGNKSCVNPEHLKPVTKDEHYQETLSQGRTTGQIQQAKTHCPHGHPYTPENTYSYRETNGGIGRQCKTCARLRESKRRR